MQGPASSRARKWMVVIGTRPEAIKTFPVVHALRAIPNVDVRLCVSGQHPDLVDPVLAWAELAADLRLNVVRQGQALDGLFTRLVMKLGRVFRNDSPSRILVHGDTLTTLADSDVVIPLVGHAAFRAIPAAALAHKQVYDACGFWTPASERLAVIHIDDRPRHRRRGI